MWSIFNLFLKTNPCRRLRRRPQGAAAPCREGIFQNMFEKLPYLAWYLYRLSRFCITTLYETHPDLMNYIVYMLHLLYKIGIRRKCVEDLFSNIRA